MTKVLSEVTLFIDFVSSLFCMTQLGHWIDANLQYDYLRSIILRIVFFRHCPNYLPSLPPIRATFTKNFPRWNSRFESQFWTKKTIHTIYKNILKRRLLAFWKKNAFIDQKCTSSKYAKNLGVPLPPLIWSIWK